MKRLGDRGGHYMPNQRIWNSSRRQLETHDKQASDMIRYVFCKMFTLDEENKIDGWGQDQKSEQLGDCFNFS